MKPEAELPSDSPFAVFKGRMRKLLSVTKTELDEIRKQETTKKQRPVKPKRRAAV